MLLVEASNGGDPLLLVLILLPDIQRENHCCSLIHGGFLGLLGEQVVLNLLKGEEDAVGETMKDLQRAKVPIEEIARGSFMHLRRLIEQWDCW